jgi:hypothetical protein
LKFMSSSPPTSHDGDGASSNDVSLPSSGVRGLFVDVSSNDTALGQLTINPDELSASDEHSQALESNRAQSQNVVSSRLFDQTAATKHGHWTGQKNDTVKDLPKFSTAVRRASLTGEIPSYDPKVPYRNPYKDSIQSRFLDTTTASTHGKWSKEEKPAQNEVHGDSPTSKNRRRFSTTYLPSTTTIPNLQSLPSDTPSPYDDVKPRLHNLTAAVKNAQWEKPHDGTQKSPESPRFRATFSSTTSPPQAIMSISTGNSPYKDITSRLNQPTAATENAKYTPPPPPAESSPTKFNTTIRRTSLLEDFSPPPPVPEIKKYKEVESRLHAPTTASKEGAWKKEQPTPATPDEAILHYSIPPVSNLYFFFSLSVLFFLSPFLFTSHIYRITPLGSLCPPHPPPKNPAYSSLPSLPHTIPGRLLRVPPLPPLAPQETRPLSSLSCIRMSRVDYTIPLPLISRSSRWILKQGNQKKPLDTPSSQSIRH